MFCYLYLLMWFFYIIVFQGLLFFLALRIHSKFSLSLSLSLSLLLLEMFYTDSEKPIMIIAKQHPLPQIKQSKQKLSHKQVYAYST